MKESPEVKALQKALGLLNDRLDVVSKQALSIKEEYDTKIEESSSIQSRIAIIQRSIVALDGGGNGTCTDPDITGAIKKLLKEKPMAIKDLQTEVEAMGFSRWGVRRALQNDISFMRVGKMYTLRDSVYAKTE